jgi:hypothetical protein
VSASLFAIASSVRPVIENSTSTCQTLSTRLALIVVRHRANCAVCCFTDLAAICTRLLIHTGTRGAADPLRAGTTWAANRRCHKRDQECPTPEDRGQQAEVHAAQHPYRTKADILPSNFSYSARNSFAGASRSVPSAGRQGDAH